MPHLLVFPHSVPSAQDDCSLSPPGMFLHDILRTNTNILSEPPRQSDLLLLCIPRPIVAVAFSGKQNQRQSLLGCLLGSVPGTSNGGRRSRQSEKLSRSADLTTSRPSPLGWGSGAKMAPPRLQGAGTAGPLPSCLHQSWDAWHPGGAGLG